MAILKRSMRRKNADGVYDVIHLESDSSICYRASGRTVELDLTNLLPSTQTTDVKPTSLPHGMLRFGANKAWVGGGDGQVYELGVTIVTPTLNTYPHTYDFTNLNTVQIISGYYNDQNDRLEC